jgi:FkbM family methyltransferase
VLRFFFRQVSKAIIFVMEVAPAFQHEFLYLLTRSRVRGRVLMNVLPAFPIEVITVRGKIGTMEGAAADTAVIQKYAVQQDWSPKALGLILDFFQTSKTGTYVDIGANIGLTAIPVAAEKISVLAFEPEPKNFGFLKRNSNRNHVSENLKIENVALLDRSGQVTFELSPDNYGDHRYRQDQGISLMNETQWSTVRVEARTLDHYFSDLKYPIVLKIDTQGAEPLVIKGGPKTCAAASLVICEFSPYAMNRMGTEHSILVEYFKTFSSVQVYGGEGEDSFIELSGKPLVKFLDTYFHNNKLIPYGKYLNLIGRRI